MIDERMQSLVVLALVIVAFGTVAAAVDVGSISGGNQTEIDDPDPEPDPIEEGETDPVSASVCPEQLDDPALFALAIGAVVIGAVVLYLILGSLLLPVALASPIVLLTTVFCSPPLEGIPLIGSSLAGFGGSIPLLEWFSSLAPSTPVIVALLGLGFAGALAFLFVASDEHGALEADDAGSDEAADLGEIGRAAGDAADRIEAQTDLTNEVYRAWDEMTRQLHVSNPEATTPDEFETAAIEAGMAREDVSKLTRLFEEVRYGEHGLENREGQAVAALRRIEAAYAEADDSDRENGVGGEGHR